MATALQNVWHLRTVAETSAKSCIICFKPTTAVLITPDNKDFFYTCRGHLKDRGFCSSLEDPEAKKKEALRLETEKIQKEYREKLAAKNKKEAEKKKKEGEEEKDKDKDKEKDDKDKEGGKGKKEEGKEKDGDAESDKKDEEKTDSPAADELPRIYALHRNFFQMRLDRIRKAEIAKRNRERLSNPATFPSVPSGLP